MTTQEEYAWAAGLFEGEGYFTVHHPHHEYRYPRAGLNLTDRDVIYRFADIAGGKVYGPYDRKPGKWKPLFEWRLTRGVDEFFEKVRPFLGERRLAQYEEMRERVELTPVH